MAASDFTKDIIYLRRFLNSMGFRQAAPTVVMEDNTACIEWGNNVVGGRERAKHIDLCKHFAHEAIKDGLILVKVPTSAQLADIMTKGIKQPQWDMCIQGLLKTTLHPSLIVVTQEGE